MPWTESRSRDEWLAEVRRRGERMQRRRRVAVCAVGAAALLLPALALASFSAGGGRDRQLHVAAGGPVPTSSGAGVGAPPVAGGENDAPTTTAPTTGAALPESSPPAGPLLSTTTTEAHGRVAVINGAQVSPSTAREIDDPVVRPVPRDPSAGSGSAAGGPGASPPPVATTVPANDPALAACPASEVRVTVTTDKPSYAAGEGVRWSSTLENRSATTCLVSGRAFFRVENGAGKTVSSFVYTANYMMPVKAEPGKTITNTASWDQRDCTGSACVQAPAGSYVVVAEWTEGGPYVGRGSFQIGG